MKEGELYEGFQGAVSQRKKAGGLVRRKTGGAIGTGAAGATTTPSNAATLQVETVAVVVSSQPSDATVDEGQTATFTTLGGVTMSPFGGNAATSSFEVDQFDTPSGGGGGAEGMSSHTPGVTYQWEKSDNGGGSWNPISAATNPSYTTGLTTYSDDHNDQYRCVISAVGAPSDATTNAVVFNTIPGGGVLVEIGYIIDPNPSTDTGDTGS